MSADLLRDLARAKAAFQLRAIEAVIRGPAIADRSATASRRETGVARKGESGGASAIAQGQVT